jgi:LysM repeat protein
MSRSTLILFVLLIVLGAVAYFILPSSEERESSDKAPEISYKIDSASVVKIVLARGQKSMTLENVGGKWMITSPSSYTADPVAVLQILQGLSKFRVGSLISSNPEKQRLFQVDSSGTQITTTERSGKTNSMIIGKMGPSFSEVYCRPPASKNVFLGEGLDSWTVTKELKEWRDKTIASIPSESVQRLSYSVNNKEFDYVRDSTSWKLGETTVESSVMNPPLSTLASFRADDFVDTTMRFQTQPVRVSVKGATNVALELHPVLPDSSKYYVQSSASPQIYVINKYTAQQLLKPVDHSKPAQKSPFAKKEEPKHIPPPVKTAQKQEAPPPQKKTTEQPPAKVTQAPEKSAGTQPVIQEKPATKSAPPPVVTTEKKAPAKQTASPAAVAPTITEKGKQPATTTAADDEGDLTVYTVKAGDTMPLIAKKFNCSVEQILKWNLLKSINVKPGQELYIYEKK